MLLPFQITLRESFLYLLLPVLFLLCLSKPEIKNDSYLGHSRPILIKLLLLLHFLFLTGLNYAFYTSPFTLSITFSISSFSCSPVSKFFSTALFSFFSSSPIIITYFEPNFPAFFICDLKLFIS